MRRLPPLALLVLVALSACGGRPVGPNSGTDGGAGVDAPVQHETYHRANKPDAINLSINADGTWHMVVDGCDYRRSDCGRWALDGDRVVLKPRAGAKLMGWVEAPAGVVQVVLVRALDGGDTVQISAWLESGSSLKQYWRRGRVCATCGAVGPTSVDPCPGPLPRVSGCTP
jgi:hypothetical protein